MPSRYSSGKAMARSRAATASEAGYLTGYLTGPEAVKRLRRFRDIHTGEPFTAERAERLLEIAREFTYKAEPCLGGIVGIRYRGRESGSWHRSQFEITDRTGKTPEKQARKVETAPAPRYTHKRMQPTQGGNDMAARPRTKPAVQEVEAEEEEGPYDAYLTANFTPNQQEYIEWFETEVAPFSDFKNDLPRLFILGLRLYANEYQQSESHRANREARKQARAAANGGAETEEVEEAPARPRTRGRKPAAAAEPAAPARPARRARGRSAPAKEVTEAF